MKSRQVELTEEVARLKKEQTKQRGLERRMSKLEIGVKERDQVIKLKESELKQEQQDAKMATYSARKEMGELKKKVATLEKELKSKQEALLKRQEKKAESTQAESEAHFCLTERDLQLFHRQTRACPEVETARSERVQSKRKRALQRNKDQVISQLKSEIKALRNLILKIKPDMDQDELLSQAPSLSTFLPRKLFPGQQQIKGENGGRGSRDMRASTAAQEIVNSYEVQEQSDQFSLSQIYYFRPRFKPIRKKQRSLMEKVKAKMEEHESLTIIGSCLSGAGLVASLYLVWRKFIR